MKHERHRKSLRWLLPLAAVCLLAAGCEPEPQPGGTDTVPATDTVPQDPVTVIDTLPPDTVWVSPPYDTAAAREGRVWRSEETWREWHREGNSIQMQLHGYAVTTTLQGDNLFETNVVLTSSQRYFEYFSVGVSEHRYLYAPDWGRDSTLYLFPSDTPLDADTNPSPYIERMGTFRLYNVSDTSLYLYSDGHATSEHIRAFTFKKM